MSTSLGTRAFLFADLRGYTRFVEAHGDAAASELLVVYRDLVRGVIGRHDGAEIRTEGDGVYVVFDSVADAVDAGLELTEAAGLATAARPDRPIRLAAGIHAGETTAGDEGPVGSAVNVAARICAKAEAGEILVSETVRALVRTARPYSFTALGPQQLKGVREAIALYRIEAARRAARLGLPGRHGPVAGSWPLPASRPPPSLSPPVPHGRPADPRTA
jgi:adenylate cyclase